MSLITLSDLNRIFEVGDESVHALQDINLHIEAGEYLSLMGPSGSGKSTLLNMLGLLDRPSSGHYLFDGRDTTTLSEFEQARLRGTRIGFIFQFFHLVPRLSALENVELPLMLSGEPIGERRRRARTTLTEMGLEDRMHHRPDQLSGGQRQRVAIARATINRPDLILADEPTGNLDSKSGAEVIALLERLREQGITLIVVTHDLSIGDRAMRQLKMVDGFIVKDIHSHTNNTQADNTPPGKKTICV
jgi:putative ABC transport system ATP-binding protein